MQEALAEIQRRKSKLYQLLIDEGIKVPEIKERIQAEYEELIGREELLRAEAERLEREENERLDMRARISSAIEYARELGQAMDHLTPDEREEIMSTLLDEVVLEDRGDFWGVQLSGALPCSWGGPEGQFPNPIGGPYDPEINRWGPNHDRASIMFRL